MECPLCAGQSRLDRVMTREMMLGTRESFEYARCDACASLWLVDPPEDMGEYYPSGYYSMAPTAKLRPRPLPAAVANLAMRLPATVGQTLGSLKYSPRFLSWFAATGVRTSNRIGDIGSGAGEILRLLEAYGFEDLWGFDPFLDQESHDGAVQLRRASLKDVPDGFDVLMAHHSLEHMSDPVAALCEMRDRTVQGGVIVIRIPVSDTFADRTYGGDWVQLDAPRHLVVPSERGFLTAVERAGMTVARSFYDSYGLQFWGSEQYRKDISLRDPSSVASGSEEVFSARDVRRFDARARRLNRARDGDQAVFVLRTR